MPAVLPPIVDASGRVSAIIYGQQSGVVRRIVVCDSLNELLGGGHVGPGEAMLMVNPGMSLTAAKVPDLAACRAMVAAHTGGPSPDSRCVVISNDTLEIETVAMADPTLDAIPGKTLALHPDALPGWKRDPKTGAYVEPTSTTLIPAGTIDVATGIASTQDQIVTSGGRQASITLPADIVAAFAAKAAPL